MNDKENVKSGSSPKKLDSTVYRHVLHDLSEKRQPGRITRVAIDGVDGSGKTFFANALADCLAEDGLPVIRASVDDFHNVRSKRYEQGRLSAQGFYQDSYDYTAFVSLLLQPLSENGSGVYRAKIHDVSTDAIIGYPDQQADPDAILIVDGIFLNRSELTDYWNYSVFLNVNFKTTFQRMVIRDGAKPDPLDGQNRRYHDGQLLYFEECNPKQRASIVIDNRDFHNPRVNRA